VIRLFLTNTANTRVFKVALDGARMKLVGSDGGRYEREQWVDDVVVAPSERAIVDVLFEREGHFALEHLTPERTYRLASFEVASGPAATPAAAAFAELRINQEMVAAREGARRFLDAPPDKTLALIAEMDFDEPHADSATLYVYPMHPEVVSAEPGSCPKCGMKLMPQPAAAKSYQCPMHPDVTSDQPDHCPQCGMKLMPSNAVSGADTPEHSHEGSHHGHGDAMAGGIEWEDMMVEVNRATTSENVRWKVVDRDSGRENAGIDWVFDEGDMVKIRLINEMESDHPMHHPFHVHGECFLVLARDGVAEDNAVWKDTVLIPTGQVVDILMDASNPGLWMAHCHIAEHMESGMMFNFRVRSGSG
jgi:FtsP/CotA-like multicopper oxidase with cupredoxin domain